MARGSEELVAFRKDEILNACAKLYQEKGFHDITIKDISAETSFSRPSIYNYFQTKEEIFLGLLIREYDGWARDIEKFTKQWAVLTVDQLAQLIAKSLEERVMLLKISAMNLYEIEQNSRYELLLEYKTALKHSLDAFDASLEFYIKGMTDEKKKKIRYAFFPFMYGIYPYVYPTNKQCKAMRETGILYEKISIYEITYNFLTQILH